jgi:predicted acyltransferase
MILANRETIMKPVVVAPATSRLKSLDVLRGFDMFWIIGADALGRAVLKLGGGEEAPGIIKGIAGQLEHVKWEGFRFYDLIFPLFVFMVGMSAVFSLSKIVEREGQAAAVKRIARRAALLFLLGALYDAIDTSYGDGFAEVLGENLLCGVLQRIALCYLVTGILVCYLNVRGIAATFAIGLVAYWAVLSFVPVPGATEVVFERGNNIIHYFDQKIPPYYGTDPESLMTTIPAVLSCLLGALAAFFIRDFGASEDEQAKWFLLVGLGLVVAGYLWSMQMPIIKRLWTPSYIFVAGGYSLMLLGALVWIIDVNEWEGWEKPFLWIGANSMAVYFFENIVNLEAWAGFALGKDALSAGVEASLAVLGIALAIGFVYVLYKKEIYIRV